MPIKYYILLQPFKCTAGQINKICRCLMSMLRQPMTQQNRCRTYRLQLLVIGLNLSTHLWFRFRWMLFSATPSLKLQTIDRTSFLFVQISQNLFLVPFSCFKKKTSVQNLLRLLLCLDGSFEGSGWATLGLDCGLSGLGELEVWARDEKRLRRNALIPGWIPLGLEGAMNGRKTRIY